MKSKNTTNKKEVPVEVVSRMDYIKGSSDESRKIAEWLQSVFENINGDNFKKSVLNDFLDKIFEQYLLDKINIIDISDLISKFMKKDGISENTKSALKVFRDSLLNNKKKDDIVSRGIREIDKKDYNQLVECMDIIINYANNAYGATLSRDLLTRITDAMEIIRQNMISPGSHSEQVISDCVETIRKLLGSILDDTAKHIYLQNRSVGPVGQNDHSLNIIGNAISRLLGFFRMLFNSIRTQDSEERKNIVAFVENVIKDAKLLQHTRISVIESLVDKKFDGDGSEESYNIECDINELMNKIEDKDGKLSDQKKDELKMALLMLIFRNISNISFDKNKKEINLKETKLNKLFDYRIDFKTLQSEPENFVSIVDQLVSKSGDKSSHKKYDKLSECNAKLAVLENRIDNLNQFINIANKNTQLYTKFLDKKDGLIQQLTTLQQLIKTEEDKQYQLEMERAKHMYNSNRYKDGYNKCENDRNGGDNGFKLQKKRREKVNMGNDATKRGN